MGSISTISSRPIQSADNSSTLYYFGHGKLESSPSTSSILHVLSHELDHVAEYRAKAARENAVIHSLDIKVDYEIRDGMLVAVSGETSVTMDKNPRVKNPVDYYEKAGEDPEEVIQLPGEGDASLSTKGKLEKRILEKAFQAQLADKLKKIDTEIRVLEKEVQYSNREYITLMDIKLDARYERLSKIKNKIELELLDKSSAVPVVG
ncbi:MAG: hypothetical protein H7A25_00195 [Leptospiraceae bacterium]|nr:hypothetical protein [Leptospiraceae bacterium]MCP5498295.1 hypothetical protein [Leptospiraceae bacterium]